MTKKTLLTIGIVAAIVIVALLVIGSNKATAPSGEQASPAPGTTAPGETPSAPSGAATSGTKAVSINITAPASGDKWEIGKIHTIKWSQAAGVTGGIELVNAATGNTVGWILSQTGANQTSYDWDTKQISLSRDSALGKQIEAGTYSVKIIFDNKNYSPAQSAQFSVAYASQITVGTYNVDIRNYSFGPQKLTVKQGDKVIFTNYDSVQHTVTFQARTPIQLASGASYTLETSSFSPGPYNYYCSIHPSMTGTLTVQ